MPQRFKATENAIEKGLENVTPKAAIGLIESWETDLQGAEFTGSKGLIGDLGKLRKELEKDELNGEAVAKLIGKLGASTTKSASKIEDEKIAEKVRHLGEALTNSETHDGSDDDAG